MTINKSSLPLIAYLLLGVIWGSNFIYMKMAAEFISPLQVVFYRVLFGFIPVLVFACFKKVIRWSHFRHSLHFFVMSLLATSVYYFGFAKGSALLLSGLAGALSGSIPLFSFVLAICFISEEKSSLYRVFGILIGFVGVALIARPTGESLGTSNLEGVFYMVMGSLSVGASFVYAKKYIIPLKIPALALTAYQLGFGLLSLALVTDYDNIQAVFLHSHTSLGLIIGLGLLGTGLAYMIYYYLVDNMGAIAASSVTYIPPVVALLIGAILVGEPIQLLDYLATALIFAGVYLLKRI